MKNFSTHSLLSIILITLGACVNQPDSITPDPITIVKAANIYTVDSQQPKVEAFAIKDGRFIGVGSLAQLNNDYPNAQTLDLQTATIVPGLIDAHGHVLHLGTSLQNVDLMGTRSKAQIIERLRAQAAKLEPDQWLIGRGWDQNDWPVQRLPTAADLDAAFPNRPVWLERVDGHASWANSAAMATVGRDLSGDWQVDGGEIIRAIDSNGVAQATGLFLEQSAERLVQAQIPKPSEAVLLNALALSMQKIASVGLTSVHDAGTNLHTWQLLKQLQQQQKLTTRVYAMADGANEMFDYLCTSGAVIDDAAMLTARSIKLYSDGALGSRGAALLADYSDDPGNKGLLIESQASLTKHANKAVGCGLQVNIHAIGDRGNRVTLEVLAANQHAQNRHRIEHSQVIALEDFSRFKELGLIASVQPTHATSDMYWAEKRVGKQRIKGAYAWQKFNALGIPLALGSDFPVEQADPLHGFYAAVTRQDKAGWPADGWYAQEKLSRAQALHGFTLGAAYAAFQEDLLGSIEVGKLADFTVLSQDIMQVADAEILNTQIVATYLAGEAVYQGEP